MIEIIPYLSLALFFIGIVLIVKPKHYIVFLFGIEFILNAGFMMFVVFDRDGAGTVQAIYLLLFSTIALVVYLFFFRKLFIHKQNIDI